MKKKCSEQLELLKSTLTNQEKLTLSFGRFLVILTAAILFIALVGMGLYTLLAPLDPKQERLVPPIFYSNFNAPTLNPVETLKRKEELKKAKESFEINLNDVISQVQVNSQNLRETNNEIVNRYEELANKPENVANMKKLAAISNSMAQELKKACDLTINSNKQQKDNIERDLAQISEKFKVMKNEISTNHMKHIEANIRIEANCVQYGEKINKIAKNLSETYSGRWGLPLLANGAVDKKIYVPLNIDPKHGDANVLLRDFEDGMRVREVVYVDDRDNFKDIRDQDETEINLVIYKPTSSGYLDYSSQSGELRLVGTPWASNGTHDFIFEVGYEDLQGKFVGEILYGIPESTYSGNPIETDAKFELIHDDDDIFMNNHGEIVLRNLVSYEYKKSYEFKIKVYGSEVNYVKDVVVLVDPYTYQNGDSEKANLPVSVNNLVEEVEARIDDPIQMNLYIDSLLKYSDNLKRYYDSVEGDLARTNLLTVTNARVLAKSITAKIKTHALNSVVEYKRFKYDEKNREKDTYIDRIKTVFSGMMLKFSFTITALFWMIFVLLFFAAERHFRNLKVRHETK